jgi:hypothetical protein
MADRVAAVRRDASGSSPPPTPPTRSVSSMFSPGPDDAGRLDLSAHLLRAEAGVVKARAGAVLSRGFILKTDHYPSGAR